MTRKQLQALEDLRRIVDICHTSAQAVEAAGGFVSTRSLVEIMEQAKEKLHELRAVSVDQ